MLELKNIVKTYKTGELEQKVLKNVSLSFRKSEFASILGASGSGKTTLLNIIGGLDKYTKGDLIINNISTKEYTDADWDSYRNHRIGFVFQSYNLISHQTVLQNVTLALTLSGISKKEGIKKAKKALEKVGLKDHINKMPNQLSGGQMQRVAIARAIVNDPEILLADEPTGALDSETSIQIMELLKEISKDRLVIMVTHNPVLAKKYSTRIINLKDGKITSDSNPYNQNEKETYYEKTKKTVMSFLTALSLSFNNLMTKKGRTILVSFAGSIGIIGIALIISLSTGFQRYIDKIQEDTLSSYPLTITNETADMTSMLLSMVSDDENKTNSNIVSEKQYISNMFSNIATNDLHSFKNHLEENIKDVKKDVTSIKYMYSVDPIIYTKDKSNKIIKVNPNVMFSSMISSNSIMNNYSNYSSVFNQMVNNQKTLEEQYDVLAGRWPKEYNEMIVVLPEKNSIPDLLVYFLGLRDMSELKDMVGELMEGKDVESKSDPLELTYDDFLNIKFKLINSPDMYKYNSKYNVYEDMSEDDDYIKKLYNNAEELKIVGVVSLKEGTNSMILNPGISYTEDLIKHVIDKASKSSIVNKQLNNKDVNVFSNVKFSEEKKEDLNFEDMISVDEEMLKSAFNIDVDKKAMENMMKSHMNNISNSITTNTKPAYDYFLNTLTLFADGLLEDYIANPKESIKNPLDPNSTIALIHMNDINSIVSDYMETQKSINMLKELEKKYVINSDTFSKTISKMLEGMLKGYIDTYNLKDDSFSVDPNNKGALIPKEIIEMTVNTFISQAPVIASAEMLSQKMTEAVMQKTILTNVGDMSNNIVNTFSKAFNVDAKKIKKAFKFNMTEDELKRIMNAVMSNQKNSNATSNLVKLGYQDLDEPTSISIYFNSFDSKENFMNFLKKYNDKAKSNKEEDKVIKYTDLTGILMSSVKKVVNSVSYVLIAFISISLIVSSIMIGIITYISVLERTKEIGILRAIGASKKNISSIFNAETFIIGLLSGLMGIGITLLINPIINSIIHSLAKNVNISAVLPFKAAMVLIILSVVLTLIGGLIPASSASKKDPVVALRTE